MSDDLPPGYKPHELADVRSDPRAPYDIARLPDYWDQRRAAEGKPDKSRCGADLRQALANQSLVPLVPPTETGQKPLWQVKVACTNLDRERVVSTQYVHVSSQQVAEAAAIQRVKDAGVRSIDAVLTIKRGRYLTDQEMAALTRDEATYTLEEHVMAQGLADRQPGLTQPQRRELSIDIATLLGLHREMVLRGATTLARIRIEALEEELEQRRIEVRFYEAERGCLGDMRTNEPLPAVNARALVTYHKEAWAEGFAAACAKHGIEDPDANDH